MRTIIWIAEPRHEARCNICGASSLLPMDKPPKPGGYICKRCRLAVLWGRAMEALMTLMQLGSVLAIIGLMGGMERELIGGAGYRRSRVAKGHGQGAPAWLLILRSAPGGIVPI